MMMMMVVIIMMMMIIMMMGDGFFFCVGIRFCRSLMALALKLLLTFVVLD